MNTNVLFVDTESNPTTKEPQSIQWRYRGEHGIITEFNEESFNFIKSMWDSASAVVGYNVLYDLGVLSVAFTQNTYDATEETPRFGSLWVHKIFGHHYHTRKLGFHHNLIRRFNLYDIESGKTIPKTNSTPVIDLLKLWAVLVDNRSKLSLSAVCNREFEDANMKEWSEDTALTDEYRIQDVVMLERLFNRFLEKVSGIKEVSGYTLDEWSKVSSPATFPKREYERVFPHLKEWQKKNDAEEMRKGLKGPIKDAYFGGLTISFYRGKKDNTAWFDLKGSYSKSMQVLNTDGYLRMRWRQSPNADVWVRDKPYLCRVRSTTAFQSIDGSLKIYRTGEPGEYWLWSFDLLGIKLLVPETKIEVLEIMEPVPMNDVESSLPGIWDSLKDEEERLNGKSALREFYKLLSNTSYGVKAQTNPHRTIHTNLSIAGMITSRSRLALLEMADECRLWAARELGLEWLYSDTDSVCIALNRPFTPKEIESLTTAINRRIYPFIAECEGYNKTTHVLSLKRYYSIDGEGADKIMLHGKGVYKVSTDDLMRAFDGDIQNETLYINQLSANTPRSMKIMLNRVSSVNLDYAHPYMFERDVPTERTFREWFLNWYVHIDTKMDFGLSSIYSDSFDDIRITDSFKRGFWFFPHHSDASDFYSQHGGGADLFDPIDTLNVTDEELAWLYRVVVEKEKEKSIKGVFR
mgnify:CR=1 FL=1